MIVSRGRRTTRASGSFGYFEFALVGVPLRRRHDRDRRALRRAAAARAQRRASRLARLQRARAHAVEQYELDARRPTLLTRALRRRRGRDPAALGADRRDASSRAWSPRAATSSCSRCSARARTLAERDGARGRRHAAAAGHVGGARRAPRRSRGARRRPARARPPPGGAARPGREARARRPRARWSSCSRPAPCRRPSPACSPPARSSCCGVLTIEQAYRGDLLDDRRSSSAGMIPLSTAMTETGAAATARRRARRRRRRRRAARAAARALRADGGARPADQQHGDGADRDPGRRLGRGGHRRLGEAGADVRRRSPRRPSFLTPVATPANLMVMEPGGYRFGDYWKLGLPLLVLFGVVAVAPRPGLLVVLSGWTSVAIDAGAESPFVSTGHLPPSELVQALVAEAHERYRAERRRRDVATSTRRSRRVPRDLFGDLRRRRPTGATYAAGDADVEFTIMSVVEAVRVRARLRGARRRGAAASGSASTPPACRSTRSSAVERSGDGRTNPMVNPGAIAATSLVPGVDRRRKWTLHPRRPLALRRPRARARRRGLSLGVARPTTATRPRPPARRATAGSTATRPRRPTSTRGSAPSSVTATDLAVMGATLADGGVNPLTARARGRPGRLPAARSP